MTDALSLLFLHGIGTGDPGDRWKTVASETLSALGYPGLDGVDVIAPKYAHALRGWDEKQALPGITVKDLTGDAARKNRRDFERREGAIEFRLGRHDRGNGNPGVDAGVGALVDLPPFEQAEKYLSDPQIRAQVLHKVISSLQKSGRVVIVAHSLGSVVAADLLRRLPVGLSVAGMVTIGSPLANNRFDVDKLSNILKDPPTNLAWWVNFWNAADPVAAHRGLSSVFPWLIDFKINTHKTPLHAHNAVEYLGNPSVAAAIGFALFGSLSKEVERAERGVDVPLDAAESLILLALRYAHLAMNHLDGDKLDRFRGALRKVQATVVDEVATRNEREGRPTPWLITRLGFDFSDSSAAVPEPLPMNYLNKDEAVLPLTVLASENVIRPFEIALPKDAWRRTMEDLAAEMSLGSPYGTAVFAAVKEADEALRAANPAKWIKLGALGVGAVALVFATGGLILAAGPGLAGAAAITSALATFGPGGMIGGLLTAGTLVSAGGGGIAYGLASSATSAKTLEQVISRRLAAEILRKKQGLDPDPSAWTVLAETEIEVRREHERLDEFSDESAQSLKELKRKIDTVARALKYLADIGLDPKAGI
jgi:pimeloyl-ACP methyl ester carboxylesterase